MNLLNKIKKILQRDICFFSFLFIIVFILFRNAFKINFFLDDFFFLRISRANNLLDFLKFFSPVKEYSYRPFSSEVFYFIIHIFRENTVWAHLLVFATYFVGLYYLYKSILIVTKNELLSKLTIFLYAVNFVHVFQLYYLGTYQEIAAFTFLSITFYLFESKKYLPSIIFYILALLSKETAILFFPFLLLITVLTKKKAPIKKSLPFFAIYLAITASFYYLYQFSLRYVTVLDQYKLHYSPRLILNNFMWYVLWGLGLPNFTPVYFVSIFKPPVAEFWAVIRDTNIQIYLALFGLYILLFVFSTIIYLARNPKELKSVILNLVGTLFGFIIFLGPILLFTHKWMVRLTLPLVFLSLFEALVIFKFLLRRDFFGKIALFLIVLFVVLNIYGTRVHESSSLFFLENRFVGSLQNYINKHKSEITKHKYLYFKDETRKEDNAWGGSEKLKVTLHDQDFLDYFLPEYKGQVIYNFEDGQKYQDAYEINSNFILRQP